MLKTLRSNAHTGLVLLFLHAATLGLRAAEPPLPVADPTTPPAATNPLLTPPPVDTLPAVQAPASAPQTPTTNVTINLINALVKKGILTAEEAQGMVAQAAAEAAQVQSQISEVAAPPVADGDVRVTYIPETVRNQIREQVTADLVTKVRDGDVKIAGSTPEWTERIKWFGDFRFRSRNDIFPEGNDNTGAFPIFNQINTGAPFDVSGTLFSPQYNVDQDRYRMQLRARLGMEATLGEGWYAGMRFGTGENNNPVSQNQGLGSAGGGQGGQFSKYALWLDRAFLRYERGSDLADNLNFYFGRFDSPFYATEVIWNENIGFDGIAFKGQKVANDHLKFFAAGGLFPVFSTDLNFATNQPAKFESTDKWLYGGQLGVSFKLDENIYGKFGAAYYKFEGVQGELSDPFIPLGPEDAGNTDGTRPSFAQKGNTYRSLRNIIPSVINNFGTTRQYQYFGLASAFEVSTFTGEITFANWQPYALTLSGEFVQNQAFDKEAINEVAINNRGADPAKGQIGVFDGSDIGYTAKIEFGAKKFEKAGDWSAWLEYRSIGSDAVIDAFNDNYWGGGGTNMEGYSLGAAVALSKRVKLGARWWSTNEIVGPPVKNDVFLLDLSAKF